MSFVHRTQLRGREAQLADATEVLAAAIDGGAGSLVISGPAGAGKSRLLEAVVEQAGSRGLVVLRGSGDADAITMPMAPLLQAVLRGPNPLMDRIAVQNAMANEEVRYILIQEISEAIEQQARRRPVMVAIDDLQFCDTTTLFALRVMVEQLTAEPVVWLVATRLPNNNDAVARTLDRIRQVDSRTLAVSALSEEASIALAEDVLGARLDDNLRSIVIRADGEVLDLVETLQGLIDEKRVQITGGKATLTDTSVPMRLRDSVNRRLNRLSPLAVEAVVAASTVGRRFTPQNVAALVKRPLREVSPALREAETARLVTELDDAYFFHHDLIREAVELTLPPDVRREMRRAAVDTQLAMGASVAEVAGVLAASAEPGDVSAAGLLECAAAETAKLDPSTAADLLARAAEIVAADPGRRDPLVAQQVMLLWRAGRTVEAQQLGEQSLIKGLNSLHEAEIRLGLARVAAEHSYVEARRQTSAALSLDGLPEELRAQLLATRSVARVIVHDFVGLERDLAMGLELARRCGDRIAEASLMSSNSTLAFYQMDWETAFQMAAAGRRIAEEVSTEASIWMPKTMWTAILLGVSGYPDDALGIIDREIAEATAAHQGALLSLLMMIRSRILLEAGRLSDAQSEADAVLTMNDWRERNSVADFTINFVLRRVAQFTGDPDDLRRSEPGVVQMLRDEVPSARRPAKWLAAIDAAAAGRPDAAIAYASEGADAFDTVGDAFTIDPADEPLFARIALAAGRPDLAARAADYTETRAARNPDFRFLAAVALHTRGLVDADPGVLNEAVELFATTQRPLPRAAALEDAGNLNPDRDVAIGFLDQANDIYGRTGALRDASRVRQRLRSLGVRRSRPGSKASADKLANLTRSEIAVVQLVARGGTNRQVAEQLFLSPHTVNSHLRHAFTKLGIKSRIELARLEALVERKGSD